MKYLKRIITDLLFPAQCIACSGKRYNDHVLHLCMFCFDELPFTYHFELRNNLFEQRFWGRLPLCSGASLLFFQKDALVQNLIYRLKYDSGKELARFLGRLLGTSLAKSEAFETVDYLVPVPLHRKKKRKRGYNQTALICLGVQESWDNKPIFNGLKRLKNTGTQTKMGRLARLKNLEGAMVSEKQVLAECPHFLIIDDVMTTGTTLEICALALLEVYPKAKISVATLAFADLW